MSMRLPLVLLALILSITSPSCYATDRPAAKQGDEVCTAKDYEDGTCSQNTQDDEEFVFGGGVEDDIIVPDRSCQDTDEKCPTYAKEGACTKNPGYMTHHCASSCNTCAAIRTAAKATEFADKTAVTGPCMDDDYRCLEWAGMGECDANPNYMKKSCRHACVMCNDGTNQFGIGQRLPDITEAGGVERHSAIKKAIDDSIDYMKTVWKDEKFVRVRHKCKNQHQDCTFWAGIGECEANPQYMQTNCAPACQTCDLLDIAHRCPILPGNECIWEAGDLNKLMETIVDNADGKGEYLKFNPVALSRPKIKRDGTPAEGVEKDGPWVVSLSNFLSEEEADRLVNIGKQQGYERSADVGKEKPDGTHESLVSESRTSHNTWCQEPSCYEDPLVAPVVNRIANITGTKVENSEYLQLLQYEVGQYYKQHHDYIGHHKEMPCGVRILTLFIYLSDVEAGGGTNFPLLDLTVQPKKGSAVLWPSVLDSAPESKDHRTDHQALPVEKGLKYGANAWIHSRNFKEAFAKHCH